VPSEVRPAAGESPAGPAGAVLRWSLPGGVEVACTGRAQGDMADPSGRDPVVAARRQAVCEPPWARLRQVHGARVVTVRAPTAGAGAAPVFSPGSEPPAPAVRGDEADAAVTAEAGVALAVLTADCAPVAFASREGVIGLAHAGWRGLFAGVIEATVVAMRALGAGEIMAVLGPCIGPECYPFGAGDLDEIARRLGDGVRARDRAGAPALDLPAGVRVALDRAGATLVGDARICTACSRDHWSWRARADRERQATVAWRP